LVTAAMRQLGVEASLLPMAPPLDQLVDHPEHAVVVLDPPRGGSRAQQIAELRGAIERLRPHVVVTFLAGPHARMFLARRTSRLARDTAWIVAERGNTRLQMLAQSPVTFMLRLASFRDASRIVTNSPSLAANVVAFEPDVGSKLTVIPNVVLPAVGGDREAARQLLSAAVLLNGAPLIGALGSFQEERNYTLLARALPLVVAQHRNAQLVVIGRNAGGVFGEESGRFRAIVAAAGLADRVTLAGELPDARRLLPAFDVVVQPSKLEGSSNSLVEALGAGVALATTPVADATALVGDAASVSRGWTAGDLADAICDALSRATVLRSRARERHAQLIRARSAEAIGGEWKRLFEAVVAPAPHP
jgi:glycosyltransferase involved in cell wall biosynthesis